MNKLVFKEINKCEGRYVLLFRDLKKNRTRWRYKKSEVGRLGTKQDNRKSQVRYPDEEGMKPKRWY